MLVGGSIGPSGLTDPPLALFGPREGLKRAPGGLRPRPREPSQGSSRTAARGPQQEGPERSPRGGPSEASKVSLTPPGSCRAPSRRLGSGPRGPQGGREETRALEAGGTR
eukprot:3079310-Pyramimonas_sp.AAC.1